MSITHLYVFKWNFNCRHGYILLKLFGPYGIHFLFYIYLNELGSLKTRDEILYNNKYLDLLTCMYI